MSRTAEFDNLENPYRPPAAVRSAYGATADVQSQVDELRVFVGGKANYYLQKWAPRLQDPQAEVGMNWAAFFLTAMWMCYRKMYRVAFIFYGVTTLVVVAQYVVFVTVMGLPAIPAGVGLIGNVAAAVICGLYGNAWYLAHAERLIAEARAQGSDEHYLGHVLARRGGTSLLAALGVPFALGLLAGIVMAFALIITHAVPH